MYRFFVSVALLLIHVTLFGQAATNIGTRLFLNEYRNVAELPSLPPSFIAEYDLTPHLGTWYIGVLCLVDHNELNSSALQSMGVINDTRLQDLWTFRVPIHKTEALLNVPGIRYAEIAEPVDPYLRASTIDSRTDSVNHGLGGLAQGYSGEGVVIAIIDWGFDYTHPTFYDTTLTHLRVSRAWDQNKLSGPPPQGYSFGTEYIGMEALLQAQEDTLYVFGPGSHGTHVAGIAGGMGAGTPHKGAAPEAELIFVSLRRDAPSLIDAFSYVTNYAASVGKPFVVNMSFGSHLGPHDGSSLKNYGMDILHGPGKVFVGSAGNNGTNLFHIDMDFNDNPGDTMRTIVGFGNFADQFGQTVSMWGSANSSFAVSVKAINNFNEVVYETPFLWSGNNPSINETVQIGNEEVHVILEGQAQFFLNDKPNFRLQVARTGGLRILLELTSDDSHIHLWNCVRLHSRYTNWGQPFLATYPGSVGGDFYYGLGEPAGVGKNVITVASYLKNDVNVLGQVFGGQMSTFTSHGPTVDERTKPDIASTGQNVISSVNSFDPTQSGFSTTVAHNGKTYGFRAFSGTSMSAPMVTGIVALMLQANPLLSATEAKMVLKETARLDQHTGNIGSEGHLQWGWGKANALAAVLAVESITRVSSLPMQNDLITVFPNPAMNTVSIAGKNGDIVLQQIDIFNLEGQALKTLSNLNTGNLEINIGNLPSGTYLVRFESASGFGVQKLQIVR